MDNENSDKFNFLTENESHNSSTSDNIKFKNIKLKIQQNLKTGRFINYQDSPFEFVKNIDIYFNFFTLSLHNIVDDDINETLHTELTLFNDYFKPIINSYYKKINYNLISYYNVKINKFNLFVFNNITDTEESVDNKIQLNQFISAHILKSTIGFKNALIFKSSYDLYSKSILYIITKLYKSENPILTSLSVSLNSLLKSNPHNFHQRLEKLFSVLSEKEIYDSVIPALLNSMNINPDNFSKFFDKFNPKIYIHCLDCYLKNISNLSSNTIEDVYCYIVIYLINLYTTINSETQLSGQGQETKELLNKNFEEETIQSKAEAEIDDADETTDNPSDNSSESTNEARKKMEIIRESKQTFKDILKDTYDFEKKMYADKNNSLSNTYGSSSNFSDSIDLSNTINFTMNDNLYKYTKNDMSNKYIRDGRRVLNKRKQYKILDTGIIPKNRTYTSKRKGIVLIDASGSCHDYLSFFCNKIYHPKVDLEIYFFDTQLLIPSGDNLVTKKSDLVRLCSNIPKGGGTNLNAPLDELMNLYNNTINSDLTIFVLTDGYMPVVKKKYRNKIIIYTTNDEVKFTEHTDYLNIMLDV